VLAAIFLKGRNRTVRIIRVALLRGHACREYFAMKDRILVPALQSCILEPIWKQFSALLPEREVEHPLDRVWQSVDGPEKSLRRASEQGFGPQSGGRSQ
jgi:hypothetical protein